MNNRRCIPIFCSILAFAIQAFFCSRAQPDDESNSPGSFDSAEEPGPMEGSGTSETPNTFDIQPAKRDPSPASNRRSQSGTRGRPRTGGNAAPRIRRGASNTGNARDQSSRLRARSEQRRSVAPETGSASADVSSGTNKTYSAFRLINERNIFNASRSPRTSRGRSERGRPAAADVVTLVGTLSSENGTYAFFDSSNSRFRQVLPTGKEIGEYQLLEILADAIILQHSTNKLQLHIGGQLRRGSEGWQTVDVKTSRVDRSDTGNGNGSADLSTEDAVAQRLMRQREEELK